MARTKGRPHCPDCGALDGDIDQYLTAGVGTDVVRLCHCLKCGHFFKTGPEWDVLKGTLDQIARDRRIPGGAGGVH